MNARRFVPVLVLALLFTTSIAAAAGPPPDELVTPASVETEPNDDFSTAEVVGWGARRAGTIGAPGDVDIFFFQEYGLIADTLSLEWTQYKGSPLQAVVSLYSESRELLAEYTCAGIGVCFEYRFPSEYHYVYVKIADATGAGGSTYAYRVRFMDLGPTDPNEPNDTPEQATPLAYDQFVLGVAGCGDIDTYRFEGKAGDEIWMDTYFTYGDSIIGRLLDADLNLLDEFGFGDNTLHLDLPTDGYYYLTFQSVDETTCDFGYRVLVDFKDQPVYVSFATGGAVRGIQFAPADVLRYWTRSDRWEMYLDLSDLGLNGNLAALGKNEWYDFFYLGFAAKYTLPGIGTIYPQDVVELHGPWSVGETTAGELEFFFDGSDVGLTTPSERIDALANDSVYGPWYFSTQGVAKVPFDLTEMRLQNEDLAVFTLMNPGQNSAGTWEMWMDGSTYGFAAANLVSADTGTFWDSDYYGTIGDIYWLSFDRPVRLNGVAAAPGDILACYESQEDEDKVCDTVKLLLDVSELGLGSLKIDAFEVGQKQ